jgi:MoaA/NifB/PqqE/SkfB family radical SAM enzyme
LQIIKSHLKTAISEVQDMGSSVIGLTGGEPLLRNDLEDIIPCIDNRSMLIIFTTGYKLTRERVRRLKEAGLDIPVISLDHYKAEIHDKGRRRQGMFEYALNAIRMFQEEEFYVAVSFYEDFPCLTLEAAEYLALMKIKLLGLDTP